MFSPKVVNQKLASYTRLTGRTLKQYPVEFCQNAIKHFDSITIRDKKDQPTTWARPLTADEQAFITNEQLMCQISYQYASERYCLIDDAESLKKRPLTLRLPQLFFMSFVWKLEELGLPIMIMVLKARQIGATTLAQAIIWFSVVFLKDISGVVASSDPDKSRDMVDKKLISMIELTPWWLTKAAKLRWVDSGEKILWSEDKTRNINITLAHGNQTSDIGRGTTFNRGHLCLAPDTLVRTLNGELRQISELAKDSTTILSDGGLSKTVWVGKTERKAEEGVELRFWGNPFPLKVSKDHPILTPVGFKHAEDLKVNDFVWHPIRPITEEIETKTAQRRLRGSSRYGAFEETTYTIDFDFGWVVGLYMAEGSVRRNLASRDVQERPCALVFSIHEKEVEYVVTKLRRVFPLHHIGIRRSKTSKSVNLEISDNGVAGMFYESFGGGLNKRIPDEVWKYGNQPCLGLVAGYVFGDGWKSDTTNDITVVSTRPGLIIQLRDLLASLGIGWSNMTFQAGAVRSGRLEQDRWNLHINGTTGRSLREMLGWHIPQPYKNSVDHWHWEAGRKGIAVKVKAVENVFIEEFWSLTVEDKLHDFATIHCTVSNTEICDWINEGRDHVEASLKYTFHPSPETFLLLESTAKGRDNYWHSLWLNSKEGWPKRKSQICPIFIPWYVARDIYPTQGWLNLTPVPKDWKPELKINNILITELHAKNAMEYVRSSEELRRELGADWTMPIEQQWWYEFNFEEAIRNDRLGTFLQECPASDLEAFQSPAKSIFSPLLITTLDQQVEQPKGVFTLLGDEIISEWTVDSTEWAMRRDGGFFPSIPIKHKYQDVEFNWALQPLKFNGYNETSSPLNRLFIWEWPKDNHEYAVALDTAGGEDKDRLVFQVIRKATSTERPVQVAEFASGNIAGLDCLPIWLCLLKLYTVRSINSINYAMAAPEMMHDGPAVTQKLMSLGWPNFYIRKENEKGEQAYTTRSLVGFKTTAGTRPHLVTYLKNFLKTQKVKINSPWLIDEMRSFVRKVNGNTNKVREEHDTGQHDDRLFALAIGLVCLHDLDLYGSETPDWRDLNSAKEMLTKFATIKDCNLVSSANNLIDKFYGRGYDEGAMNRDDLIVTEELSDPDELDFNGHYASDLADLHKASKLDLEGTLFEFSSYEGFVRAP